MSIRIQHGREEQSQCKLTITCESPAMLDRLAFALKAFFLQPDHCVGVEAEFKWSTKLAESDQIGAHVL